jgi:hypothetical protein
MKIPNRHLVLASALAALTPHPAPGADSAARPKDAAEAVQEGNVRQWIEYYERTREAAPKPKPPATNPPEPAPSDTTRTSPRETSR